MNIGKSISIIIPFYNVEKCIERCLSSVARQSMTDLEVLLIDDCSTDKSTAIVEQFIAGYHGTIDFKIIRQSHNQGQSAARNRGIQEAGGHYIYFLDSDDYISNDCLSLLYQEFQNHPDLQMVIGNYEIVGPLYLAPFAMQQRCYDSDEIIREQLRFGIYSMPWNKLIKKSFLMENRLFFQPGIVHEDNLWSFCSAFCFDRIGVVLKPTYYYIIRQGSTERSHTREWHQQQLFEVFKHLVKFIFLSDAPSKKNVKNRTDVFRFIERDQVAYIMEPYQQGDRQTAFTRYQEIRSLPYWSVDDVTGLSDITPTEIKLFRHQTMDIEEGFRLFTSQHETYQTPNEYNTMKLSVIVISNNQLEGLRRTIPSILSQTYTGYELIVIDRGSEDGSKEYLQSQVRIDAWLSESDEGIHQVFHRAVSMAHCEYCLLLEAGNTLFSSQSLEHIIYQLNGADLYSGCAIIYKRLQCSNHYPPATLSEKNMAVAPVLLQSTFIKTVFFKNHPPKEHSGELLSFPSAWLSQQCHYEKLSEMVTICHIDNIMANGLGLTTNSRLLRNQQKLVNSFSTALLLPPLQRDLKVIRNAVKTFFKDLFTSH